MMLSWPAAMIVSAPSRSDTELLLAKRLVTGVGRGGAYGRLAGQPAAGVAAS